MSIPGPLPQAFLDDMPYDPDLLKFEELLEVDEEKSLIRVAWRTRVDDVVTRSQRNHPLLHPPHVAGALMVQATAMLGFVHGYYLLGIRHHEGWIGYGTHMEKTVFRKLVPPGALIACTCWARRKRLGQVRHFVRYGFTFHHDGDVCYESEQAAMWIRVEEGDEALVQPTAS
jgi:hypothetical protein